jgi:alpha-L-rhamnosidase
MKSGIRALGLVAALLGSSAALWAAPIRLKTEGRINPLGIDELKPVFAWQSDATARNWTQSSYEVLVATSADALSKGHADVWDSGRRNSGESVGVSYEGPALKSHQRYFWSVKVWDKQGTPSISNESAWWEMGLLQPSDWQASWIRRNDTEADRELKAIRWIWLPGMDAQHAPQGTVAEFSYNLRLDARPTKASLHVFSGGTFTAKVNGTVTGHKQEWGAFDREDIRDLLKAGDNDIVVSVDVPKSKDAAKTFPVALAAELKLTGADGKPVSIVSDASWRARKEGGEWQGAANLGALQELHFGLASDRVSPAPAPDRVESTVALFRKDFSSKGKVASARLYVTALGSYEAFLNGKKVGQSMLVPGFTDYRKRVLYQTYDVTAMVAPGKNMLAAMLGAGWHGSPLLWVGSREFPGPDLLRAQLELIFADGSKQVVATDGAWQTAAAPITSSEIYAGEAYDARLETAGWNTIAGAKAGTWQNATVGAASPGVAVTAEPDEAIHKAQEITPVKVTVIGQDSLFDMGQNMVGVVRLRVKGTRGTTIKLQFAERLKPDGNVYTENLRDADATDYYTLKGGAEEVWTPAFTFHGFRYVQMSGLQGNATPSMLQGVVLNSLPDAPSIRLETSSELLNHMNELGLWGQRGNYVSVPTDCPQRDERMGWMGDAGVFWRTGSYNFDVDAFSHKFMDDVVDAQSDKGEFSNISPNLLQGIEGHPGAPGWGDAGVLVPYATWVQYGDRSIINRNWAAMERWMDFILRTNPNYLREKELGPDYADWLAPDPHTPSALVATAYWALLAQQMQEMATALGRSADATKYRELYKQLQTAYQKKYIHSDGSVEGNTQSSYVLTLYTGMAPKQLEKGLTDRLVKDIEAHQNHLTTGFLGTPFLLSVLGDNGRTDVAYSLLLNTTYPSWGYMVEKGATTWWERWNGDTGDPSMNSYNHYAFGSVMAWVYRRVAGIDTEATSPGFHHITVRPYMDERLPHVRAEYDSVYGTVMTEWTKKANGLQLKVQVPANTTATVYLPAASTDAVERDGASVSAHFDAGLMVTEVGSGTYNFTVHAR